MARQFLGPHQVPLRACTASRAQDVRSLLPGATWMIRLLGRLMRFVNLARGGARTTPQAFRGHNILSRCRPYHRHRWGPAPLCLDRMQQRVRQKGRDPAMATGLRQASSPLPRKGTVTIVSRCLVPLAGYQYHACQVLKSCAKTLSCWDLSCSRH